MDAIELEALRKRALRLGLPVGQVRRAERLRIFNALRAQTAKIAGHSPAKAQTFSALRSDAPRPPRRIDESGVRWVVAYVSPSHAREVADDLDELGFRAYCPLGRRIQTQKRRQRNGQWARRIIEFPVFGGYVFVGEVAAALGRSAHDKIVEILRDGCGALSVPAAAIRAINDAELAGRWDAARVRSPAIPFPPGAHVRFRDGSVAGFEAMVEAVERSGRVRLAFGRVRCVADAAELELA